MSVPALRQPKFSKKMLQDKVQEVKYPTILNQNYVILTLRSGQKLVVSSDAYNGILAVENIFRCVYCNNRMELNETFKELHKTTSLHIKNMEKVPYVEGMGESMMRQLKEDKFYCTICNVIVTIAFLSSHHKSDAHRLEFEKAKAKVVAYKST